MRITFYENIIGFSFSVLHLIFAFWLYAGQPHEGLYWHTFLGIPDFPVAIIYMIAYRFFDIDLGWIPMVIFGTIWWYFLGVWFKKYVIR